MCWVHWSTGFLCCSVGWHHQCTLLLGCSGVACGGVVGSVPNPWLLGHSGEEGRECQGNKVHVEDGFGVTVVVLKMRVVVLEGAHSQELC